MDKRQQGEGVLSASRSLTWVNPFHIDYTMFERAISTTECLDRLRKQTMSHYSGAWLYDCSRPLAGWITDDDFEVSRCVFYKNAYRVWAKGKLHETSSGTVVSCRNGISHLTLAGALLILVAWIAAVSFIPSVSILQAIFVLWLASVAVRLYLGSGDRQFLTQFLEATILARQRVTPVVMPDGVLTSDARQLYRTLPGHRVPVWTRLVVGGTVLVIIWKITIIGLTLWKYG